MSPKGERPSCDREIQALRPLCVGGIESGPAGLLGRVRWACGGDEGAAVGTLDVDCGAAFVRLIKGDCSHRDRGPTGPATRYPVLLPAKVYGRVPGAVLGPRLQDGNL